MVRIPAFVSALVIGFTALCTMPAAFADDSRQLQVEGQALSESLKSVAEEFGLDIAFFSESTNGLRGVPLAGNYTPEEAFDTLLSDTGLEHRQLDNGTVVIQAKDKGGDSDLGNGRTAGAKPRPVMMAQAVAEQSQTSQRTETDNDKDEKRRPLEEIIVTGTNIRGIAPESSPVRVFTREDIQISGAATAQDFIQTLPQNFGGGSNADLPSGLPNDANSGFNSGAVGSFGSSVNLRGLGSGSTLVLLNGHRLAPSSGLGDFADISMIPASAIERVEVLTDGASSIYGSDAVAGVTNFILRDDFKGVETSFRYGIGTQHRSAEEFRAGVTGGLNWDSGDALVAYEYFNQDEIGAADRSFAKTASLPNDLTPSQERHSVLASLSQDLSSNLEVFTDLTFSRREAIRDFTASGTIFNTSPRSENLNISTGGTWKATNTWYVDFSGTYSEVNTLSRQSEPTATQERKIESNIWVADIKTSGTVLSFPGGDLKLAIGGHYRNEDFVNFNVIQNTTDREADRNVYAAFGEAFIPIVGPDNAVPGIERLEFNVSGRYDHYSDFGSTANPKIGVLWAPVEALRLRGSYSMSFNPPPLGRVGATDFSVVARENSFFYPLLGITPADPSIADVVQLGVGGTSKNLVAENSRAFTAGLDFDKQWGRHELAFVTTWFDIEFENRLGDTPIPGNRHFLDAPNIAFTDPDAFPEGTIIFFPSVDQITELLDSADRVLANIPPVLGDPFDAAIINFTTLVRNLGVTQVSGLDFDIVYTYDSEFGSLTLGVDGSYLHEFKQQATVSTPIVEQVNTLFNPVDLKLRGRAGYARNGFAANLFVNYVNDYRADNTADAMRIDSWTTVDLSLSYDTQSRQGESILNDTVFRLAVLNLFDQDPPFAGDNPFAGIFGYDPTNASPLGRFISFEISKRF